MRRRAPQNAYLIETFTLAIRLHTQRRRKLAHHTPIIVRYMLPRHALHLMALMSKIGLAANAAVDNRTPQYSDIEHDYSSASKSAVNSCYRQYRRHAIIRAPVALPSSRLYGDIIYILRTILRFGTPTLIFPCATPCRKCRYDYQSLRSTCHSCAAAFAPTLLLSLQCLKCHRVTGFVSD